MGRYTRTNTTTTTTITSTNITSMGASFIATNMNTSTQTKKATLGNAAMARPKGSGSMGPTRSVRLPQALDAWFNERLERQRERSPSEVLVALVHGGLRLREGYMAIHRRVLEHYVRSGQTEVYRAYVRCLLDTFGAEYVDHLERWLAADGLVIPNFDLEPQPSPAAR